MALPKTNNDEEKGLVRHWGLDLPRPWALEKRVQRMFDHFLEFPRDWEFPIQGGELYPSVDISETPQQ